MEDRNQGLTNRLERLERTNRRLKIAGLVALGLVGMAATKELYPEVIQAKRFQVVDAKGNVLVDLGKFGSKNHPGLIIYDAKGVLRAAIGIDGESDNSGAGAYDHNGTLRAGLSMTETGPNKGTSGDFAYDKNGLVRTGVDVDQVNDFTGFFNLDTTGRARASAGTSLEATSPFYALFDANGAQRASLAVDYDDMGGEGLFLNDNTETQRVIVNVDGGFFGVGGEELIFANNNPAGSEDVGAFFSLPGAGGNFFTYDTNGNQTGHLP